MKTVKDKNKMNLKQKNQALHVTLIITKLYIVKNVMAQP